MKEKFPEFFQYDEEITKDLWDNCLFVFDTSVLLNLYEYSNETLDAFIGAMDLYKDRIKMPNWIIYEYLTGKDEIIEDQTKSYETLIKSLESDLSCIQSEKKHPYVIKAKSEAYAKSVKEITKELQKNKEEYCKNRKQANDVVLEKLLKLFADRIGDAYTNEQLVKIMKDGDTRFSEKTPPGYCDYQNKKGLEKSPIFLEKCRQYGDYIIWLQIIDIAKTNNKNVILVTNDYKKKDWFEDQKHTRKELFKEFLNTTDGKHFRAIQSDEFLEHIKLSNGSKTEGKLSITDSNLKEVKEKKTQRNLFEVIEQSTPILDYKIDMDKMKGYLNLNYENTKNYLRIADLLNNENSISNLRYQQSMLANLFNELSNTTQERNIEISILNSRIVELNERVQILQLEKDHIEKECLSLSEDNDKDVSYDQLVKLSQRSNMISDQIAMSIKELNEMKARLAMLNNLNSMSNKL